MRRVCFTRFVLDADGMERRAAAGERRLDRDEGSPLVARERALECRSIGEVNLADHVVRPGRIVAERDRATPARDARQSLSGGDVPAFVVVMECVAIERAREERKSFDGHRPTLGRSRYFSGDRERLREPPADGVRGISIGRFATVKEPDPYAGNTRCMNRRSIVRLLAESALAFPALAIASRAGTTVAEAAQVSAADRAFVAKVSQGGMYEVEASKVAERKATERDVIDQSVTEVHDHELVGAKLKSIALSLGLPFPTALNAMFAARLAKLEALSGKAFDDAYITEMDTIHGIDVQAFAIQASGGTNPALVAFAAETVIVVRRHIGALHAVPLPAK